MLIEVYTRGRALASLEPRPGYRERWLVVPGGSQLLETTCSGRAHTFLFVPTADPPVQVTWSAREAVKDARPGVRMKGPGEGGIRSVNELISSPDTPGRGCNATHSESRKNIQSSPR